MKPSTYNEVFSAFSTSILLVSSSNSSFMAQRKVRPGKLIILHAGDAKTTVDQHGNQLIHLKNSDDNLNQAIMNTLTALVFEFIEGKTSLPTITDNWITFIALSQVLVDIAPNNDGLDSLSEILHFHISGSFLVDLATAIEAAYSVSVEVVAGAKCGILLRHESPKR